ncbi:MAG TPA: alpha-amylase family glycosyl hydrolase, partial [Balneolaceae bacterium]|nr:alpha-amylase family glycosyl hydrolase [Balneolaceae bacterium]
RLKNLFEKYQFKFESQADKRQGWTEEDAILITYGDVIKDKDKPEKKSLELLEDFLDTYLNSAISTVHILSFFTSSSDKGFSVIDYKQVRPDLGNWNNIEQLSAKYRLMADLVINHTSRSSKWFMNYQEGKDPGKDYFIEVEADEDLTTVTRARDSELKTAVETPNGLKYVWTTFSDDQIDLNFTNPDVLFEFIEIFFFYI